VDGTLIHKAPEDAPGAGPVVFADVSHWQATVDLDAYVRAGYRHVALKATEGLAYVDPAFARRWRLAGSTGLARSAYHFGRSLNDGAQEWGHFIAAVRAAGGLGPRDLLVLDSEDVGTAAERPAAGLGTRNRPDREPLENSAGTRSASMTDLQWALDELDPDGDELGATGLGRHLELVSVLVGRPLGSPRPDAWGMLTAAEIAAAADAVTRMARARAHAGEFTRAAAAAGYSGALYTGRWYAEPAKITPDALAPGWRRLWISDYGTQPDAAITLPPGWARSQVIARQYTDHATIPGIGRCDASRLLTPWEGTVTVTLDQLSKQISDAVRLLSVGDAPGVGGATGGKDPGTHPNNVEEVLARLQALQTILDAVGALADQVAQVADDVAQIKAAVTTQPTG
jgi:GH25 family lysozyme M1 (1,4-beta-N-acetylmuramidase)